MRPRNLLMVIALVAAPAGLLAQQRVVVQGLLDGEFWRTKGGSRLLSEHDDRPVVHGRLNLWSAVAVNRNLLVLGHVEGEVEGDETELGLEQLMLQWSPRREIQLAGGRFPSPVGAFAPRRLSDANPLIGRPDLYPVGYPWGVMATGVLGPVDYRAAVIDEPTSDDRYVPEGGKRARPALGVGVTPAVGLRLGASWTAGSYLGPDQGPLVPGGRWEDYGQRILALDGSWSRGYLEVRAEAAFSSYEVPNRAATLDGQAVYLELKYTWTPRFFTAVRGEKNRYAFIRPMASAPWIASETKFVDGEIGAGYRIGARTLVKASFRADSWDVPPAMKSILPNGTAFAFQLSHGFDLTRLLGR